MIDKTIKKINNCRVCKGSDLEKVLALGPTPLANAFLTKDQLDQAEYYYPLDLYFCNDCGFVQLGHVVSPQILFENYVYVSSTSLVFVDHFRKMAEHEFIKFSLKANSLVIDIGSNDGILLKPFKKLGATVLGIEPAKHIAELARKNGVETIIEFFSTDIAKKIIKKMGKADIVSATNVFAHIDDLDEVIEGLKILLKDDGVFIMEAPYLVDFIEKRYFDLVYHEHLSYWSVNSLIKLFERFDMTVFDVEKVAVHGGTIRVYIKKRVGKYKTEKNVDKYLLLEKKTRLAEKKTYINYANLVLENKAKLVTLLTNLKTKGKTIAAYGAPAKGNTILNFFSIGSEVLNFVVDDSPFKQGLYTPGKHIPVVSSSEIYRKKPDYLLILAWNFAQSIMDMHKKYKYAGGKFIIPVPKPKII